MVGMAVASRMHHPRPQGSFVVILSRPVNPENIGLVARHMKNTGFNNLRLVSDPPIEQKAFVTAVHAKEILESARFYPNAAAAVSDLEVIFAAAARKRKNFSTLSFEEAVDKILSFPRETKIGLLFGNERTGLTSQELHSSNFRFTIPQASRQPSYNLASAVLLVLFQIFRKTEKQGSSRIYELPIPREEQEDCIDLILKKLKEKRFIHAKNKRHVTEMIHDLFGRFSMTARDKNLLLAVFSKGPVMCTEETEIIPEESVPTDN